MYEVHQADPADLAVRIVRERFPAAQAAFLGGSVLTAHRTSTSDLDIVVVLSGAPAPFRETLRSEGWVIELFVQTPSSLRYYWRKDSESRRTPLLRMCAEGLILVSVGGAAETYQGEAQTLLDAGPPPPTTELLQLRRYQLTDLLDDFRGCTDGVELTFLATGLVVAASELVLLTENRWSGGGKWLPRRLAEVDPNLPAELIAAQMTVLAKGDRAPLEYLVLAALSRAGGPLTEGYRVAGFDPENPQE